MRVRVRLRDGIELFIDAELAMVESSWREAVAQEALFRIASTKNDGVVAVNPYQVLYVERVVEQ